MAVTKAPREIPLAARLPSTAREFTSSHARQWHGPRERRAALDLTRDVIDQLAVDAKGRAMSRRLVVAELTAAGMATVMVAVTIARPAWIELVFRTDPDHHSGLFEILIISGLTAAGAGASLALRAQRHRACRDRETAKVAGGGRRRRSGRAAD